MSIRKRIFCATLHLLAHPSGINQREVSHGVQRRRPGRMTTQSASPPSCRACGHVALVSITQGSASSAMTAASTRPGRIRCMSSARGGRRRHKARLKMAEWNLPPFEEAKLRRVAADERCSQKTIMAIYRKLRKRQSDSAHTNGCLKRCVTPIRLGALRADTGRAKRSAARSE